MPITIRELVIRTILTDAGEGGSKQSASSTVSDGNGQTVDVDAVVEECVARVMERLREQNER